MTVTAEDLDNVTEMTIKCLKSGDQETGRTLFSHLIQNACFAEVGTEAGHIDRVMRLIEARVTPGTPLDDIRPHVESIMAPESDHTDRYVGFTQLFRRLG